MLPAPEDHAAISNLYARYCLTLDLDDAEGWLSLFTPDASFQVYGRTWDGREGLRGMLAGAPRGLHLGGAPQIEMIDANCARITRNLLFAPGGEAALRSAVYDDELRRTGDGWRIASCRCRFVVADGLSDRPAR